MAGGAGSAGGAASNAGLPCCLDNTIIEFRLIEGNPDSKKFGFDWLRAPQEIALVQQETPYVNGDFDVCCIGSLLSGFKPWSKDELDALKANAWSNQAAASGTATPKLDLVKHTDLTIFEAHEQMKKSEYKTFPIVREPDPQPYRWLTYYVPWLSLFPPIDKMMSEGSIETYAKTLEGTPEGLLSSNEKLIVKKAREIAERKANDKEKGTQSEQAVPLLEAIRELTKYAGTRSKATLRLLKDIKMEKPQKITIEYDDRYLKVSSNKSSGAPEKTKDYAMTHLVELKLPESCYSINAKIEEISGLQVTIEAIDEFASDQEVTVYAYPQGDAIPRRVAGRVIVCANDKSQRNEIKVAMVPVVTYISDAEAGKMGVIRPIEKEYLAEALHQALIVVDFVDRSENYMGEVRDHELDLKNDIRFLRRPPPPANSKSPKPDPQHGIYVRGDKLDYRAENFGVALESAFLDRFPKVRDCFFVFAFGDKVSTGAAGNVDNVQWLDDEGGMYFHFRQSCFIYPNRGQDNRTISHELLHALKLTHTHRDGDPPLRGKRTRYLYPQGNAATPDPQATNNVMSYNHESMRWQTWKWQWEIMKANTGVKARWFLDQSGYRKMLPGEIWPTIDGHYWL